jgi:hypothetical protein
MPIQPVTTCGTGPRRSSNVRIALMLGGVAVFLFLVTLWRFRPF